MNNNWKQLNIKFTEMVGRLKTLTGQARLALLMECLDLARLLPDKIVEALIDDNIELAESLWTEESAFLLGEKANYASKKMTFGEARKFVAKGLQLSRDVGSAHAEAIALAVRGYLESADKQHKKAAAWYMMALEKCSDLQRPRVELDLGSCYGKQGEYDRAWFYLNESVKHSGVLMADESISPERRMFQTKLHTDGWSRLGTLQESVGDFGGARLAYDRSLNLADQYKLTWEKYKTLSRKAKFHIIIGEFTEAEKCLNEAQGLMLSEYNARAPMYLTHDWARLYRMSGRYAQALETYGTILYGESSDEPAVRQNILNIMEFADLFGEILSGIYECLMHLGKTQIADVLNAASREYEEVLTESGIYKEADKQAKLKIQQEKLMVILLSVMQKSPLVVWYRDIVMEFDLEKKKARVRQGGREFQLSQRAFLVFKCLVEHVGQYVTRKDIEEYWAQFGEGYFEAGQDTGVRTYINREIGEILGLSAFLKRRDKPKGGWMLIP